MVLGIYDRRGNEFTKMVSIAQKPTTSFICPFDKEFQKFAADTAREVAKLGPDMIQFDDDFRFALLSSEPCCLCKHHVKKISEITGDNLSSDELSDKILLGPDNKYRQAWIEANGEALVEFSKAVRKAVDEVNPKIRMGVCSCTSSWDIDGRRTNEIDHILAGENKPFRRMIMAPYWAVTREWGNKLQNVIELERMEREWCGRDVELMTEGDVYPRPRTNCPSSYLEIFDTALRADGGFDGIIKYGLDYYSTVNYEKGYALRHVKNRPIYEQIDKFFSNKTACGVRIIENPDKISGRDFKEKEVMNGLFFTPSAYVFSENSIPTVYSGEGVISVALGENARILTEEDMKKGVIIDGSAAKILMEKGIDVGLKFISDEPELSSISEHFTKQIEYVNHMHKLKSYKVELCEGADVLSVLYEKEKVLVNPSPAAYLYENEQGYKFFVYTFDFKVKERRNFCFYARSKQLADGIEALTGKTLPAYTYGNPDIYVLAKRNENSMAVGLWNCFCRYSL